jgi:hypothetical protein
VTAGKIFSSIKRKLIESLYFESRRVEYLERLMINQGRLLAETQRHRDTRTNQHLRILDLFPIWRGRNSPVSDSVTRNKKQNIY